MASSKSSQELLLLARKFYEMYKETETIIPRKRDFALRKRKN